MKYYKQNNIILGSSESDVKPVTGLNQYCKVSMSECGYNGDDPTEFMKFSGYSKNKLKIREGNYIECPWGNIESSAKYYNGGKKFLAKNVNCPIPIRSSDLDPSEFSNNSPSTVSSDECNHYFIYTDNFTSLTIKFYDNHIVVSDIRGLIFKGPSGCSTIIIDVQGHGGAGGQAAFWSSNYLKYDACGGGGGSGAFAVILLDMHKLESIDVNYSSTEGLSFSKSNSKFLSVANGGDGGDGSATHDGAIGGAGGNGGSVSMNSLDGFYLLWSTDGVAGGAGGYSHNHYGTSGSTISGTLFSGPLEDTGVKFNKEGTFESPSTITGGGGGSSLFSSGADAAENGSFGAGGGGGKYSISSYGTGGAGFLNFYI